MQYDFLKAFPKRMKTVGLYALLFANSSQKALWRECGFETLAEQLNMIFAVLLYIMEQSLKEEACTMDDISVFVDAVNAEHFRKAMSFDDCQRLADFIVNIVLSNEGRAMYFSGCDFEQGGFEAIHISYVANRIVYVEREVRRTSYYLTDDGYNLLLGTLEVESNLKLTIQELIFQMHLEKQSYDKALDDIKNVFNLMQIQLQKIREAMLRIRRNVLDYRVGDYERLLRDDLATIDETKEKFRHYRELVQSRVREMEAGSVDVQALLPEEAEKLRNLREIERYLGRVIDEHQRILGSHFDLKALYTSELEKMAEMSLVRRFSLRTELFDKVLANPAALGRLDIFLAPLFNRAPAKIFNPRKVTEEQRARRAAEDEETTEDVDFDEAAWREEQARLQQEKLAKYAACLTFLLGALAARGKVRLSALAEAAAEDEAKRAALLPDVHIFKEVMVELLKAASLDVEALRRERAAYIREEAKDFRLSAMVLDILDEHPAWGRIRRIEAQKLYEAPPVIFRGVPDGAGGERVVRCSEVILRVQEGNEDGV